MQHVFCRAAARSHAPWGAVLAIVGLIAAAPVTGRGPVPSAADPPAHRAPPVALTSTDTTPFVDFTAAAGGSPAVVGVASRLDSTLSRLSSADPSLAATIAGYVHNPSTIPIGLAPAPGIDNAFGDLLPAGATAAQITEANQLDSVLYLGLAAAGQTGTIAALDTEAAPLTSVVAPVNASPYTLFADSVGNPDPNAAVLDANLFAEKPDVAATLAEYVENPSTIPADALSTPNVPAANDGFAVLLPADATTAQIEEATELDNLLYGAYAPAAAETAFFAPAVRSSTAPLVGDDPFSSFAASVGSTHSPSEVAGLDAALITQDQPLAAVLNADIDGTLAPSQGLLTAPAGDDPFAQLLPPGASSDDVIEAQTLDDALYTGLAYAGDSRLAATLAHDAVVSTPTTVTPTAPAPDPFWLFSAASSPNVTPNGIPNLDADFANADPGLAQTFAGYAAGSSPIPISYPAAPAGDDPFTTLLRTSTTATATQRAEAEDLDNSLYHDDPTLAASLGSDAAYLTGPAVPSATVPSASAPPDPVTLLSNDFTIAGANAREVFGALPTALSTLFSGDAAAIPGNLGTALEAVTGIGAAPVVAATVTDHTLDGNPVSTPGGLLLHGDPIPITDVHEQIYAGLVGQGFSVPGGTEGALIGALDNFAASPLSAVLIGMIGPVVSPAVALLNSLHSVQNTLADATVGDTAAVLTDIEDTPIHVVGAVFDGATLNLDALDPLLESFVSNGDGGGESIAGLNVAFGGLLSPGSVLDGVGDMPGGVGGSILNSLGMELLFHAPDNDAGSTVTAVGEAVGPIGAIEGLTGIIGDVFNGNLLSS